MIENEALNLPATERARLADVLLNSLSGEELENREKAWALEAERRIDAFESGALKARDAETVFSDLKKKL